MYALRPGTSEITLRGSGHVPLTPELRLPRESQESNGNDRNPPEFRQNVQPRFFASVLSDKGFHLICTISYKSWDVLITLKGIRVAPCVRIALESVFSSLTKTTGGRLMILFCFKVLTKPLHLLQLCLFQL